MAAPFWTRREEMIIASRNTHGDKPRPTREGESTATTVKRLMDHNFVLGSSQGSGAPPPPVSLLGHAWKWAKRLMMMGPLPDPEPSSQDSDSQGSGAPSPPASMWHRAWRDLNKQAAAGPDRVTPHHLANTLNSKSKADKLKREMIQCWQKGLPKDEWRKTRVVFVPKPKRTKDQLQEAGAWRPVGVMNTLGKLYSSAVARDILDKTKWEAQAFGSRKGIGTVDIMASHADIFAAVRKTNKKPARERLTFVGVYFDVKSAFPGTRRKHLEVALRRHPELAHWTKDICARADRRSVKVEWDGLKEEIWADMIGLDQGDPASSGIWQLVMEGCLQYLTRRISERPDTAKASWRKNRPRPLTYADAYVDDGFTGVLGYMDLKAVHEATFAIAKALEALEAEWGFGLPKEKMTTIVMGGISAEALVQKGWPDNIPRPHPEAVTRLGITLPISNEMGMVKETLKTRISEAFAKTQLIRTMRIKQGWDVAMATMAATTVILPVIAYGCEVWDSSTIAEDADQAWCQCVKHIMGWQGDIASHAVFAALGAPSIESYRAHLRRRLCIRIMMTPNHPSATPGPVTQAMLDEWLPAGATWTKMEQAVDTTWKVHELLNFDKAQDKRIGEVLAMSWVEWVQRNVDDAILKEGLTVFFIHGLVLGDDRAGAGWVRAYRGGRFDRQQAISLKKGFTTEEAEIEAIAMAIEGTDGPVLVLTNSKTAITRLTEQQLEPVSYSTNKLRARGGTSFIGWVERVEGNRLAEVAARQKANMIPSDAPTTHISVAWAQRLETQMWTKDRTHEYWGSNRLTQWKPNNIRTLFRVRQAHGICALCKGKGRNLTRHIMVECPKLEADRKASKLFISSIPGQSRGYAGWIVWLGSKEHKHTEDFMCRVEKAWRLDTPKIPSRTTKTIS